MAELSIRSVSVRKKTDWSAQPADTPLANIQALGLSRHREVEEGDVHAQQSKDIRWWVSDGFLECAGVVLHARWYTLTHLLDEDELMHHLDNQAIEPRHITLVHGTRSERPRKFIKFAKSGNWGPCTFSRIKAPTGAKKWGLVLDTKTGLIRVVSRDPKQLIFDYLPRW